LKPEPQKAQRRDRSPSQDLALQIAGSTLRLTAAAPDLHLFVPAALAPFACDFARERRAADISLTVDWLTPHMQAHAVTGARQVFDSGALWRLYRAAQPDDGWIFEFTAARYGPAPFKIAHISPDFDRGTIFVDRRASYAEGVHALEHPLDELLWIHHLARRRGIVVHACGLRDREQDGYLFVGSSGAGKTTTANLWSAARAVTILSDDRIVLREDRDGFFLHGTPWHGEGQHASAERVRPNAIFLLVQAPVTEVKELPLGAAVARILAASFPPFHDRAALTESVELLTAAIGASSCYELRFTPDDSAVTAVIQNRKLWSRPGQATLTTSQAAI
jgi:hypothetical protein